jgi:hypothetical protein
MVAIGDYLGDILHGNHHVHLPVRHFVLLFVFECDGANWSLVKLRVPHSTYNLHHLLPRNVAYD